MQISAWQNTDSKDGAKRSFFWLTAAALCAAVAAAAGSGALAAPTLTVLHSFTGSDGAVPEAGVIADNSGNLYGTTTYGGRYGCSGSHCGVVFKLPPDGTLTVLHAFSGSDGYYPTGGVIRDGSGNLFETTIQGGRLGFGVVFKLSADGTYTVLHDFGGGDGANPAGNLIRDGSGNLYGTTRNGGRFNWGVVFKLSPSGAYPYEVLHSFTWEDGALPFGRLVADNSGNLYGTTFSGGVFFRGTAFKLSPGGILTVLHFFNNSDGAQPAGGLIRDSSGNLYGTTGYGGRLGCIGVSCGVVFKLSPSGIYTVLHFFTRSDGDSPKAGLFADSRGNLYGTTSGGGRYDFGTMFKLSPNGTYTVLRSFSGNDGAYPTAELIGRSDRFGTLLYGTTSRGGASDLGVVFKLFDCTLCPPPPPPTN